MSIHFRKIKVTVRFNNSGEAKPDLADIKPSEETPPAWLAGIKPQPLDMSTQNAYRSILGDMSDVRIFQHPAFSTALDQLRADAAAQGKDIFIRQGKFNLDTAEGRGLLAHELTHAAQDSAMDPGAAEQAALYQEKAARTREKAGPDRPASRPALGKKPDLAAGQPAVLRTAAKDRSLAGTSATGIPSDGWPVQLASGELAFLSRTELQQAFYLAKKLIEEQGNEFEGSGPQV